MSQAKTCPANITVLYFAAAYTAVGRASEVLDLPKTPFPLGKLGPLLVSHHPKADLGQILDRSRWSVEAEMIPEENVNETLLQGGEEVAIICPVSGG